MIVRACTLDDVDEIIRLGVAMQKEADTEFPDVQPETVRQSAQRLFFLPEYCALIAENDEGVAIGFLTGLVTCRTFNDELFAVNDMFFIDPEQRSFRAFMELLRAFDGWAQRQGAKTIMFGVSTGKDLSKLMQRVGYERIGETYFRRI